MSFCPGIIKRPRHYDVTELAYLILGKLGIEGCAAATCQVVWCCASSASMYRGYADIVRGAVGWDVGGGQKGGP